MRLLARPPERELYAPAIDLVGRDGSYVIRADVPGATRRSTEVFLEDNCTLLMRARRTDSTGDDAFDWGGRIDLPGPVDDGRIHASEGNGVLTIELGKRGGGSRRIPVSTAG